MRRPFFIVGTTFAFSLFLMNFLSMRLILISFAIIGALLFFSFKFIKFESKQTFLCAFVSALIACVVFFIYYYRNVRPVYSVFDKDVTATVRICDVPYKSDGKFYYTLKVVDVKDFKNFPNFKLNLITHEPLDAEFCDDITLNFHIFDEDVYNFNYAAFLRSKGIFARAYFSGGNEILERKIHKKTMRYYILILREKLLYTNRLLYGEEFSKITSSFLLNFKRELSEEPIAETLKKSGVYHLLGFSSLYLSLLIQFLLKSFKRIGLNNKNSSVICIVVLLFFNLLMGFSFTIAKVSLMLCVYLFGKIISRESDSLSSLGFSVLILSVLNPDVVLDVGFWLSFLTSLGIMVFPFSKFFNTDFISKNKALIYIFDSLSVSLSSFIFTFPVLCVFLGKISIVSIFTNLLLLPVGIFIFVTVLITNFLGLMGNFLLLKQLVEINILFIKFFIKAAVLFGNIPYSAVSLEAPYIRLWVSFTLILIALAVVFYEDFIKSIRLSCFISANLLIVSIFSYDAAMNGIIRIAVLNVDDGVAMFLHSGTRNAMIFYPAESTNYRKILNYIFSNNVKKLDLLLIPENFDISNYEYRSFLEMTDADSILAPKYSCFNCDNVFNFDKNAELNIWSEVSVKVFKYDKKVFLKVWVGKKSIGIFPDGGDVNLIPKNLRDFDFVIANGLPNNYSKLSYGLILPVMNNKCSKIMPEKLAKSQNFSYIVSRNEEVFIDFKGDESPIVRRKI